MPNRQVFLFIASVVLVLVLTAMPGCPPLDAATPDMLHKASLGCRGCWPFLQPGKEHVIMLPNDIPLVLSGVPAGSFMMGRYPDEQDSEGGRQDPQHKVTLTKGFYMGKYPVTQAQWLALMGSWPEQEPEAFLGEGDNYPAYFVSWNDAQDFITALNNHIIETSQGSGIVRLPTEAEWEYAYRAGTTTRYYWGDDPEYTQIGDYAWYRANANFSSQPVGLKLPNKWNLFDMSGNVWEWCQDWYGSYPSEPVKNPTGPSTGLEKVLRGGAYYRNAPACRAAMPYNLVPEDRGSAYGFRIMWMP